MNKNIFTLKFRTHFANYGTVGQVFNHCELQFFLELTIKSIFQCITITVFIRIEATPRIVAAPGAQ